jgi:inhibitor of cysteine peptidase
MEIDGPAGPSAVTLPAGEELSIRLPENPTTGYRWSVNPDSLAGVLTLLDSSYESGGSGVGAGGVHTFRFAAGAVGTAQVTLSLARPWESAAPAEQYSVAVTVDG